MKKRSNIPLILVSGLIIVSLIKLLPLFCYWQGKGFYEQEDYYSAAKSFKYAYHLDPKNKDYKYYFVRSLSNLEPTYEVQKAVYDISTGKEDDSARSLAEFTVNEWKATIHQNVGANYIEQAPAGGSLIRWSNDSFPLKVYLDNRNLVNLPSYYKSAISRAFSQWDKSIDFVSFENVSSPQNANIIILFEPLPSNVCNGRICRYVVGYTTPTITGFTLKHMTITLYDKNHKGEYFSDKEIYNTILHELGHALGIMGHSYNSIDLMYLSTQDNSGLFGKYRSDFNYLSGSDVNTLNLLYMLEPNVSNKLFLDKSNLIYAPIVLGTSKDMAKRKLVEAQSYIKSSPKLAVGYINQAVAYEELGEYKKALKSLLNAEKYAKDDNERHIIYHNLSVISEKLDDYENAQRYSQLAAKYK